MSKNYDVCIRGDGIVGRTLALLLAQQRLRVALVGHKEPPVASSLTEPAPESSLRPGGDVRAYAMNEASRQLLEQLRAWPDSAAHGDNAARSGITPVQEMQIWGDQGGAIEFSAQKVEQPALAWIADVPALLQRLGEALRFQPQIETISAASLPRATLTVHCEGQSSPGPGLANQPGALQNPAAVRTARFGAQWYYAPYAQKAIAARLQLPQPHQGIARQWFMTGGEVLALLPMGGAMGSTLALVWSVAEEKADALEKMDDAEFCAALQESCSNAIAAGAATAASADAEPTAGETAATKPARLLDDVQLCSPRATWPLALSTAQHWVGPGWALAGDAAHTVHPLAGQGLNLGLADAACLAQVLAAREYWRPLSDERLLRRYERARKSDVASMSLVTDGLQSLFTPTSGPWQIARNFGMNGFDKSGFIKRWAMQQAAGK